MILFTWHNNKFLFLSLPLCCTSLQSYHFSHPFFNCFGSYPLHPSVLSSLLFRMNMSVQEADYLNVDIAKKTGLDKYFLKRVEVYLEDGRVFVGFLEVLDHTSIIA